MGRISPVYAGPCSVVEKTTFGGFGWTLSSLTRDKREKYVNSLALPWRSDLGCFDSIMRIDKWAQITCVP